MLFLGAEKVRPLNSFCMQACRSELQISKVSADSSSMSCQEHATAGVSRSGTTPAELLEDMDGTQSHVNPMLLLCFPEQAQGTPAKYPSRDAYLPSNDALLKHVSRGPGSCAELYLSHTSQVLTGAIKYA